MTHFVKISFWLLWPIRSRSRKNQNGYFATKQNFTSGKSIDTLMAEMQPVVLENKSFDSHEKFLCKFRPFRSLYFLK